MATKTAKKKIKRAGKKPAAKAAKKKTTKKTAKAKKAKTKAKKPARPKVEKPVDAKPEATGFAIHEGHKAGGPITESDVVETPPKLRVLEGNPIKAGKKVAYTAVIEDGKYKLGIAAEGEAGYYRIDDASDAGAPFATHEEAVACAEVYNERLGLTKLEASRIVLSSIGEQNKEDRESGLGETDEVDDDGESDPETDSDLDDDLHSDSGDDSESDAP